MSESLKYLEATPQDATGSEALDCTRDICSFSETFQYINLTDFSVSVRLPSGLGTLVGRASPDEVQHATSFRAVRKLPLEYKKTFVVRHIIHCGYTEAQYLLNDIRLRREQNRANTGSVNTNLGVYMEIVDTKIRRNDRSLIIIDYVIPQSNIDDLRDGESFILNETNIIINKTIDDNQHPFESQALLLKEVKQRKEETSSFVTGNTSLSIDLVVNAPNNEIGTKYVKFCGQELTVRPTKNSEIKTGTYLLVSDLDSRSRQREPGHVFHAPDFEILSPDNGFFDNIDQLRKGTDPKEVKTQLDLKALEFKAEIERESLERKVKSETIQAKTRTTQDYLKAVLVLVPLALAAATTLGKFFKGMSKIMAAGSAPALA